MALKQYNPTSPARRFMTALDLSDLSKKRPERALTEPLHRSGGRNNKSRITIWFRGGGHKRNYRVVDSRRDKPGVPAKVAAIEYDPNRSARLALLHYADGEKRYILCPEGLKVGASVMAGEGADILPGNALPLKAIPAGTMIHNMSRPCKEHTLLGTALVNAGYCYARTGDAARALAYSDEAMKIFRELCNQNMIALAYRNYGTIEARNGRFDEAFALFEKSVRSAKASGVEDTLAACCYEYGMTLIKATVKLHLASKLLKKASAIYRSIGNTHKAREAEARAAAI